MMPYDEEHSRLKFEEFIALKFWNGLFPEYRRGTFEQNLEYIKENFPRDEGKYKVTSISFRDINHQWELWQAAVEVGYQLG
jgi:hypothetical protein